MKDYKIGIVIPFTDLSWLTINCLKSIVASTDTNKIILYLMNNDSSVEETEKLITYLHTTDLKYEHVVFSKNNGFVLATNHGIRKAMKDKCTHVVMLNNDTIVTDGWIDSMVKVLDDKKVGIVSVMSSPPDWRESALGKALIEEQPEYDKIKPSMEGFASTMRQNFSGMTHDVGFVAFFCAMLRVDTIKDIGLLSEDYNIGLFDDDDYCHRLRASKYSLKICKDVYVHHFHNSTFIDQNVDYMKLLEENRKVFEKKYQYDPWDREKVKQ